MAVFDWFDGIHRHGSHHASDEQLQVVLTFVGCLNHFLVIGLSVTVVLGDALIGYQAESEHRHATVTSHDHFRYRAHSC